MLDIGLRPNEHNGFKKKKKKSYFEDAKFGFKFDYLMKLL